MWMNIVEEDGSETLILRKSLCLPIRLKYLRFM